MPLTQWISVGIGLKARKPPSRHRRMRPYGMVGTHRFCVCPLCRDTARSSRAQEKRLGALIALEQMEPV